MDTPATDLGPDRIDPQAGHDPQDTRQTHGTTAQEGADAPQTDAHHAELMLLDGQLRDSQRHYSDDGLWAKVKAVARKAGIGVVYLALILYYTATAPTTPAGKKSIIYGALGYFILPLDVIPDAIPVVGFTDDMAALVAVATAVASCITPDIKRRARLKLHDWFGQYDPAQIDHLLK